MNPQIPNPFFRPLSYEEPGVVFYKQTRNYKAEDGLALEELARNLPGSSRVDFLPIDPQAKLIFTIGEVLQTFKRNLSDGHTLKPDWPSENLDQRRLTPGDADAVLKAAAAFDEWVKLKSAGKEKWWKPVWMGDEHVEFQLLRRMVAENAIPDSRQAGSPPDAANVLIVGRPQYFSLWWQSIRGGKEKWPDDWFKILIQRAGYPARFVIPHNPNAPIFAFDKEDRLYDRKLGISYGDPHTGEGEPVHEDYGVIFRNRVRLRGVTRHVTVCTGLRALGTWAAVKFVSDAALWQQLNAIESLEDDEGPVEIALRVRFDRQHLPSFVGPYQLGHSSFEILNNGLSNYCGYTFEYDRSDMVYSRAATLNKRVIPSNLAAPIRALEYILGGDRLKLEQHDPTVAIYPPWKEPQPDSVRERKELLPEIAGCGGPDFPPECIEFAPFFAPDTEGRLVLKNGVVAWDAIPNSDWDDGNLCVGPGAFVALWNLLKKCVDGKNKPDSKLPIRPILLRGESGSGKDLLIQAVARAYYECARDGNQAADPFVTVLSGGALAGGLPDQIESAIKTFDENKKKGVLFIDEFSDLSSPHVEVALLRLLQEGSREQNRRKHKVLILAATSQRIENKVRTDLMDRFDIVWLPPWNERLVDALAMLLFFLHSKDDTLTEIRLRVAALKLFWSHTRLLNVRQLSNAVVPQLLKDSKSGQTVEITSQSMRKAFQSASRDPTASTVFASALSGEAEHQEEGGLLRFEVPFKDNKNLVDLAKNVEKTKPC